VRLAAVTALDLDVVELLEEEDELRSVPAATQELEERRLVLVEVTSGGGGG
jgi:hypothetical protein